MAEPLPYRDFYFPLNVFMHILMLEEGEVRYLHYGLFERDGESIVAAQERSTELLLEHLPPPPARILDVGAGLGTTLVRLAGRGYDAEGITPDERQIAMIARHVRVHSARFENFTSERQYDAIVFQESSQYIDPETLFVRARELAPRVVVLDEFALQPLDFPGALHRFDAFMAAAKRSGFHVTIEKDVSRQAAPTIDYFLRRLPRYRQTLISDLKLSDQQVDDLIESGNRYHDLYQNGAYVYRLVCFERDSRIKSG